MWYGTGMVVMSYRYSWLVNFNVDENMNNQNNQNMIPVLIMYFRNQ